ncbi:MAG: glycosyltransferase [Alkalispirochaetaceae bacterium]
MVHSLEDYVDAAGEEVISSIHKKIRRLYGTHSLMINTTFMGGGVAEILNSMVPLLNDGGLDTGWRTVHGTPDFYEITKKIHNAMQGNREGLSEEEKELYLEVNANFAIYTHIDHDFVFVHDPQPLPLIHSFKKQQPWIWRCHIDISEPNEEVWRFLRNYLLRYDIMLISSEKYRKRDLPVEQRVVHPAIDPLSLKNREMSEEELSRWIREAGIPMDKPFITQVSRMDPWKDPLGVLDVYEKVRKKIDCRLVFVYNLASDDPEGHGVYEQVHERAGELAEKGDVLFVVGNHALMVNAIQRAAAVVLQKSYREGFCLTVTEAMWKAAPVVATTAGGIPEQITDGEDGFLIDPADIDGTADRVVELVKHPEYRESVGANARETVRKRFLTTRLICDYIDVMTDLSQEC